MKPIVSVSAASLHRQRPRDKPAGQLLTTEPQTRSHNRGTRRRRQGLMNADPFVWPEDTTDSSSSSTNI